MSKEQTNVKNARADTDPHRVEHTSTHMHRHSVVHCGLGIGLTAGKCCAERISEQGGDVGLERKGDGVAFKAAARSASKISNEVLSAQDKISQRKHHPFLFIKASGQKSPEPHHSLTPAF